MNVYEYEVRFVMDRTKITVFVVINDDLMGGLYSDMEHKALKYGEMAVWEDTGLDLEQDSYDEFVVTQTATIGGNN